MLLGPIEAQSLSPETFELVTMMDVLEHLTDPVATLDTAISSLTEDGLLVIQTPAAPPGLSWEEMVATHHPFLPLMREHGHLYLFNDSSLRRLLDRLGMRHVSFETAYFAAYDIFAVASRRPLVAKASTAVTETLSLTPDGRLVQALLDLDTSRSDLRARYEEVEHDRAARLAALLDHGDRLMGAEAAGNALRAEVENLRTSLAAIEADRADRLDVIREQAQRLDAAEKDRADRLTVIQELSEQLAASEKDRADRLAVIQNLGERLDAAERDQADRLPVTEDLRQRLAAAERDRDDRWAGAEQLAARLKVLESELAEVRQQLDEVEADRLSRIRVVADQADRFQTLAAALTALCNRDMRVRARRALSRLGAAVRSLTVRLGVQDAKPSRTAAPMITTSPPACPTSVGPPRLPPARDVAVYETLSEYVQTIDAFVQGRPDLAPVRLHNHEMVDVLAATGPLAGLRLLDVGASPHGFSLERALEKGVAAYLGLGLGVWEPVEVQHGRAVGRLVAAYADALPVESESVDLAMSLSTFEHFQDGAAVLRDIHRALRPGGRFFVSFQPVWTSSTGHHLHHLESVARLIPDWAHLLWTPASMRQALESRWPADASMSLADAIAWIYESSEINRVDVVALRKMFEAAPLTIEWMTPLLEEETSERRRLAGYLATLLPYSIGDLLTRGFSLMMRKPKA